MATVPQEKVDELRADIERNIPNFTLLYKEDEGWYKEAWYLWVIWAFYQVVGVFAPALKDRFHTHYSNGLYSKMVLTTRARYGDWTVPSTYMLVLHEYKHMLDMKKHPIWMPLSYILLLPTVVTMRAYWEFRGITAELLAYYEVHGEIPNALLRRYPPVFTGAMYFWMYPFRNSVRRKLQKQKQKILDGEIVDIHW